jgi:hypothetical protein
MLPADGVAPPEYLVVGLPAIADLFFHLLLDAGERLVTHVTYSRRLVLDAEKYGVLALDDRLLYVFCVCLTRGYFLSSSLATEARWTSSGPSARRRVRALAHR